jgi:SynChlorMet cassette protein ScmC
LTYYLTLADSFALRFSGSPDTEEWLGKFAAILGLGRADRETVGHIRFFRASLDKCMLRTLSACSGPSSTPALPAHSWQTTNFGLMKIWQHPGIDHLCCELESPETDRTLSIMTMAASLHAVYHLMRGRGGFPVHAALIERDGMGVLLMGRSGAGKSTCCNRLPASWHALGDDQALVLPMHAGAYLAHPLPTWSKLIFQGSTKTWNVQSPVPLAAVMALDQAEKDEIFPMAQSRAALRIAHSASHVSLLGLAEPREHAASIRKAIFDNAVRMAKAVPAFILNCSPHGRFWQKIEEALEMTLSG